MSKTATVILGDLVQKNVVLEESVVHLNTSLSLLQDESKSIKKILLEILPLVKSFNPSIANPERFGDGSLKNFEIYTRKYCLTYWIDILKEVFPAANEIRFDIYYLLKFIYLLNNLIKYIFLFILENFCWLKLNFLK